MYRFLLKPVYLYLSQLFMIRTIWSNKVCTVSNQVRDGLKTEIKITGKLMPCLFFKVPLQIRVALIDIYIRNLYI